MPLLVDGDLTTGLQGRNRVVVTKVVLKNWDNIVDRNHEILPNIAVKYAKGIAKTAELPLSKVLKSKPTINYFKSKKK